MPVEIACPGCQKPLRAHDGLLGSDALCPYCRTVVKVPAQTTVTQPAFSPEALTPAPLPVAAPQVQAPAPASEDDDGAPLMPPGFGPVEKTESASVAVESTDEVIFEVEEPATSQPAHTPDAAEPMWWAQTADGQQYGPVPKAELDSWVADGSITAECQLLRDGDQSWQWASQVYPQLT